MLGIAAPLMQLAEQLLGAEAAAASSAGVDYRSFLSRHQLVNPQLEPLYRIHEFLLALMCPQQVSNTAQATAPSRAAWSPGAPTQLGWLGATTPAAPREARRPLACMACARLRTFPPRRYLPPRRYFPPRRYRAEQGTPRPAEGAGAGPPPEEGVLPMRTVERICQIMATHFGEEAALCAGAPTLMGALGSLGAEFTAAGAVSIARLAEQFALVPQPGDERPGLLSLLHRLNRHYIQALGEGASTSGNAEFSSSSSC